MALSPAHERALNKKRSLLVRHLLLSETLYSELRSEYVLTEDYEEQIRVSNLSSWWQKCEIDIIIY